MNQRISHTPKPRTLRSITMKMVVFLAACATFGWGTGTAHASLLGDLGDAVGGALSNDSLPVVGSIISTEENGNGGTSTNINVGGLVGAPGALGAQLDVEQGGLNLGLGLPEQGPIGGASVSLDLSDGLATSGNVGGVAQLDVGVQPSNGLDLRLGGVVQPSGGDGPALPLDLGLAVGAQGSVDPSSMSGGLRTSIGAPGLASADVCVTLPIGGGVSIGCENRSSGTGGKGGNDVPNQNAGSPGKNGGPGNTTPSTNPSGSTKQVVDPSGANKTEGPNGDAANPTQGGQRFGILPKTGTGIAQVTGIALVLIAAGMVVRSLAQARLESK